MEKQVDLCVVGAGSGGVRAARTAAKLGARVAIVEDKAYGGTCVNAGCIPKKLLMYASEFPHAFAHAAGFGWELGGARFDWARLIANKDREIARLNGIYQRLLDESGVLRIDGRGRLQDAHTVRVGDDSIRAGNILLATGREPVRPAFPGQELGVTSDEVFHLPRLPERVLIVGGGYVGVEFASIFHGLGARTTQLYRGDLFLRDFDLSLREHLRDAFRARGIDLRLRHAVERLQRLPDGSLRATLADGRGTLDADCVLLAMGRRAATAGLGLETVGVACADNGDVLVDEDFRTSVPSVHAIGDVVGRMELTPVALAEGMALAYKLYAPARYRRIDYDAVPTAIFSQPALATVGLSEARARERGLRLDIYESSFRPLKLTLTDDVEKTLFKLIVDADSQRILGCHLAGDAVAEILQVVAVAMQAGATKADFDRTLGIHPTTAEELVTLREPTRH